MIKFIKPTYALIEKMSKNMRKSDVIEVMASHGHEPLVALTYSFDYSEHSTMVTANDDPILMFGVAISNTLTGLGHPWLLGTDTMYKYKERFLKTAPLIIQDMLVVCPRLVNYVHHENKTSIKWLSSLGFTIEKPKAYGVKNDLFHKFHMGII